MKLLRIFAGIAGVLIPLILLSNHIYGSFLFTFPIPFLWHVVYRGRSLQSLGLKTKSLTQSVILGVASGCFLGISGGEILKLLHITGITLESEKVSFAIGKFLFEFPMTRELGYQALLKSRTVPGLIIYFFFSLFCVGLGEEIFWRGFIQGKIFGKSSRGKAVAIVSALFALTHVYLLTVLPLSKGLIVMFVVGLGGALWGYLYEKTDNIWCAAISHGLAAAIFWKYYFFNLLT